MLTRNFQLLSLVLCFGFVVGCGDTQTVKDAANGQADGTAGEHADPHDTPLTEAEINKLKEDTATWTAAIEHVQKYCDTIKTETTGGVPAQAHRSLDLLDHVLGWLPEVAQNSNVPKEDWQTIGENSQQLRDLFNQVHSNIDDGKAPDYESVADEIDAAVAALAAINAGTGTE